MKAEAYLFTGVAAFFAVTGLGYAFWSTFEPVGTTALAVAFLMSSLVAFFCGRQYRVKGRRLQDQRCAEIHEGAGPLDFFPAHSYAPVVTALGATVLGAGIVYGVWLALIGVGVLAPGVAGFVFENNDRAA
ncbi:hypothetical protein N566_06035 [Streptomycetaceae bacterium MP113-05]|nr:hypothetical protein N566_06035 [Streptomycetaceae bacterium MP113-05]